VKNYWLCLGHLLQFYFSEPIGVFVTSKAEYGN
jgi:hypothetical protein